MNFGNTLMWIYGFLLVYLITFLIFIYMRFRISFSNESYQYFGQRLEMTQEQQLRNYCKEVITQGQNHAAVVSKIDIGERNANELQDKMTNLYNQIAQLQKDLKNEVPQLQKQLKEIIQQFNNSSK